MSKPTSNRQRRTGNRAVSPVIGVILMVAITVILAALISAFVLGFGAEQAASPQASWQIEYDTEGDGNVIFVHDGGDAVEEADLSIMVNGESFADTSDRTLTGGDTVSINDLGGPSDQLQEGDEVHLIWHQPDGDDTSILRTFIVDQDADG